MSDTINPTQTAVDEVKKVRTEDNTKNFWENIGAGGYEAVNQSLLGLPDFLVKQVGGSNKLKDLREWKEAHNVGSKIGGVGGIIAGSAINIPIKALTTAAKGYKFVKDTLNTKKALRLLGESDVLAKTIDDNVQTIDALKSMTKSSVDFIADKANVLLPKRREMLTNLISKYDKMDKKASEFASGLLDKNKFIDMLEKVSRSKNPLVQSATYALPTGAVDYGTNEDLAGAAIRTGIGVGGGTIAGGLAKKIVSPERIKSAANVIKAKAMNNAEFADNYILGKAGIDPSSFRMGSRESGRVGNAVAREAGEDIERMSLERVKEITDAVKPVLVNVIKGEGLKNPLAFSKLLSEKNTDIIRSVIQKYNKGLNKDIEDAAVQVINASGLSSLQKDIPEALSVGKNIIDKASSAIKPVIIGAGIGAGVGGAASIPDILQGNVDMSKITTGALLGASPMVIKSALPAVIRGAARATSKPLTSFADKINANIVKLAPETRGNVEKLMNKLGSPDKYTIESKIVDTMPKVISSGVGNAITRAGAMSNPLQKSISDTISNNENIAAKKETEKTQENLDAWSEFRVKRFYDIYNKLYPTEEDKKKMSIEDFGKIINSVLPKSLENPDMKDWSPETLARSAKPVMDGKEIDFLTDAEIESIQRDYTTSKKIRSMEQNKNLEYMLREKGFIPDLLSGVSPNKLSNFEKDELFRTLLAPKPGTIVSAPARIQLNNDIDMIRKSGLKITDKIKKFKELLRERYGYNPDFLSSMGLGE